MDRILRVRPLTQLAAAIALLLLGTGRAQAQITFTPAGPQTEVVCVGTAPAAVSVTAAGTAAVPLTLTATSVPSFVTFTGGSSTSTSATGTATLTTATINPTAAQAGIYTITYTATQAGNVASPKTTTATLVVDNAPTITLGTPQPSGGYVICTGQQFSLDVTLADQDLGDSASLSVTGTPPGVTYSPNLGGNDASGPGGSDKLVTTAAAGPGVAPPPVTTRVLYTPTAADIGSHVLTFIATDTNSGGVCTTTRSVTLNVQAPTPTTVIVTTTPADLSAVAVGTQVCYNATVLDQCGNPVVGAPVTFSVNGTTGNNTGAALKGSKSSKGKGGKGKGGGGGGGGGGTAAPVVVVTNEEGVAQLCFTPLFPGATTVTITTPGAAVPAVPGLTAVVPVGAVTPGAQITGAGIVDMSVIAIPAIPGIVTLDIRGRANGTWTTGLNLVSPTNPGKAFRIRAITVDFVSVTDVLDEKTALVFGTASVPGLGVAPFRADIIDGATPGVPGDAFVITILNPDGTTTVFGSGLRYYSDRNTRILNDIHIGIGIPGF